MNRARLLPVVVCVGGLLIASGCSQGPWGWGKPEHGSTGDAGAAPGADVAALAANGKPDAKTPKNPFALARVAERQGDNEKAEHLYQEIIKKTPKNAGPYHRLGVMYLHFLKKTEAPESHDMRISREFLISSRPPRGRSEHNGVEKGPLLKSRVKILGDS